MRIPPRQNQAEGFGFGPVGVDENMRLATDWREELRVCQKRTNSTTTMMDIGRAVRIVFANQNPPVIAHRVAFTKRIGLKEFEPDFRILAQSF